MAVFISIEVGVVQMFRRERITRNPPAREPVGNPFAANPDGNREQILKAICQEC